MKKIVITLLIVLSFSSLSLQVNVQYQQNDVSRRFLGSIGSWITDNIISPINDHVISPIGDGIGTVTNAIDNFLTDTLINNLSDVVNTITDPFISFGNLVQSLSGTVSNAIANAVNDSIDFIKDSSLTIVDFVGSAIFSQQQQQPSGGIGTNDACMSTCFVRINLNNQLTDYYFDKPNGCISKGFLDPHLNVFNDCCDKHNQCLNSKCCTNDCQSLKNECDAEFERCNKEICLPLFNDNTQFYTCLARGSFIASSAVNRTCNTNSQTRRKLCYCHVKDL